ncbi:MAG: hypothetical protein LBD96_05745 [Treponema sp.]|jgi:hypothetical protein|nr:hypothetical protein [Treponema sp.]
MAKATDLYVIMRAYSNKNNSPYIDIDTFIAFLSKYVVRLAAEQPEWADWVNDTSLKFWNAMGEYSEDGRCVLLTDTPQGRVYLPYYIVDRLKEAYRDLDESADIPFPNEDYFAVKLPPDQTQMLSLETDLVPYFDKPVTAFLPVIKLVFLESGLDALILAPMIPHRLLEAAILKIRYHVKQHNNREYYMHKLLPMFQNKEGTLREALEMLNSRPLDCLNAIEGGGEVTYLFWASLCSFLKNDLRKKTERLSGDVAVLEGVHIVETCLNLYKTRLQREREKETALRSLDQLMDKPPYYFTQDQIIKFTDTKGALLLNQYTEADLNAYIKKKVNESVEGAIPEWLVVQSKNGEQYYLKKDKYLPLVTRLIFDAQNVIKQEVADRWTAMLGNFKSEPAMEMDSEFERLLANLNTTMNPLLATFLEDKKLPWVYDELERTQKVIPPASRIFERGKLIPYSLLFVMKRKDMLFDAKMSLPFWYSIPVISSIIAFFARLRKKKKKGYQTIKKPSETIEAAEGDITTSRGNPKDFINSVREIETQMVPIDKDIDSYLEELQNHWGQLLDPKAQRNLVEDVNSLVRDNLRQSIRVWKKQRLSSINLQDLAQGIINGTPVLRSIHSRDALLLYMQIYMVKILKTVKI